MDIQKLLNDLVIAQNEFEEAQRIEKEREKQLIEIETPLLKEFIVKLIDSTDSQYINHEESALIYVFPSNGKTLISPEVYMTRSGKIVYEVFDEVEYRKYRKDAVIVNKFNYLEVEEFLRIVPFSEIYAYFEERISLLEEDILHMKRVNDNREDFNKDFQENFKK